MSGFNLFKTWLVARLSTTDRGATMVEYAIMVGLIAVVVLGVVLALGGEVKKDFDTTGKCLEDSANCPQ